VLLIKVGQDGSIYGYHNKYITLAKKINNKYSISVVVSSNPYDRTDSLGSAIEVIKDKVKGASDIYYMGNSNGAILGARFAYRHPEIKKMLLINGPLMINWPQTRKGVEKFIGTDIVFVYGSEDPSYRYIELLTLIKSVKKVSVITVADADHNFKGMESAFHLLPEQYLLS